MQKCLNRISLLLNVGVLLFILYGISIYIPNSPIFMILWGGFIIIGIMEMFYITYNRKRDKLIKAYIKRSVK